MNFYKKHSSVCPVSGDRIRPHRLTLTCAAHNMATKMRRRKDESVFGWLPFAMVDAVRAGTLTPDLGAPAFEPTEPDETSQWIAETFLQTMEFTPVFPERVFKAFAKLAKAHALTLAQGVCFLVSWHYYHTGDAPARVKARRAVLP